MTTLPDSISGQVAANNHEKHPNYVKIPTEKIKSKSIIKSSFQAN